MNNQMKIRLSELRRIIRNVLEEEADLRWRANTSGEKLSKVDKDRLAGGGLRTCDPNLEEEDLEETDLDEA